MDNSVVKRINELLAEGFEVDEAQMIPTANLKDTLELDSLDYIDLIAMTEANFGCKIAHEDLINLVTFQDLYEYIGTHTKVKMTV